jgi:hypothetical protein
MKRGKNYVKILSCKLPIFLGAVKIKPRNSKANKAPLWTYIYST